VRIGCGAYHCPVNRVTRRINETPHDKGPVDVHSHMPRLAHLNKSNFERRVLSSSKCF
jgi:hypothetical protein